MSITSSGICAAADQLAGFVGFNTKTGHHIVRFSEDSFGMDVDNDSIMPACEFVWQPHGDRTMTLKRELIQLLLEQNIDDRLNVTEPLRVYMRRKDLPEITAERCLKPTTLEA
ncbi:DUF2025 family protein [Pseudomonas solani]|uniref:DUF2025 family protein n=1 Tax=Pseudomonas TaxID=286 RepID=UPI0003962FDA|nr:DUF2025 family protein [Pseudomonas sp. PDM13]EQM71819.1 hypothetical protein L682_29260 [Pseudomonas alcaligenes OT 69]MCU9949958.1 DUF2025 family protein [Pseudomonas sp. PDM13]MDN4149313.1 DUF2025 family protein [Pseudomonas tohonis]